MGPTVVALAVAWHSAAVAAERTIHVAPTGNDQAVGSSEAPLLTLKKALAIAETGDTIRLSGGHYAGNVKTRVPRVTIEGYGEAVISTPDHGIEILHNRTTVRSLTFEKCDIGLWLYGASDCLLENLKIRDIGGEGIRIKNQSCRNIIRDCRFERMGRTGFDVPAGRKNGEGIYIGTAPEQRNKNRPPNVPDRCTGNVILDCTFKTEAAEAVDIKEDSEENSIRECIGEDSRDPDGPIFGSRGDRNRFEDCHALRGLGHGFRFGGDTIKQGKFGQSADRIYGMNNVMRWCRAENNALYGVASMVQPQDINETNIFEGNSKGSIRR
jgi:hypothetical protein